MNNLERLGDLVSSRLLKLGFRTPRRSVVRELLECVYLATLRTEEARFVQGSITFADPRTPDLDPPITRRLAYPSFTSFAARLPLTVENLVKLSRTIDNWSGSIAVYGTRRSNLVAWGLLDQLVHSNVRLHGEGRSGPSLPGILTIVMDGIGALSVYHGVLFIGGLRQDRLVIREHDVLHSALVANRVLHYMRPIARSISKVLGGSITPNNVEIFLFGEFATTLARICIGLRRIGTGGALLITPRPAAHLLDVLHRIPYMRLGHSSLLSVLDSVYLSDKKTEVLRHSPNGEIPARLVRDQYLAEADARDRDDEVTGAIKVVTSLAAVDGLVLLTPLLEVVGFGVKILSGSAACTVYDGPSFIRRGIAATRVDTSRFGTRHNSMLRYCRADSNAVGIIVSQDGQVRVVLSIGRSLTLWDNVQLLSYVSDLRWYARLRQGRLAYRRSRRRLAHLGYTAMPKTLEALMSITRTKNSGPGLV